MALEAQVEVAAKVKKEKERKLEAAGVEVCRSERVKKMKMVE